MLRPLQKPDAPRKFNHFRYSNGERGDRTPEKTLQNPNDPKMGSGSERGDRTPKKALQNQDVPVIRKRVYC